LVELSKTPQYLIRVLIRTFESNHSNQSNQSNFSDTLAKLYGLGLQGLPGPYNEYKRIDEATVAKGGKANPTTTISLLLPM